MPAVLSNAITDGPRLRPLPPEQWDGAAFDALCGAFPDSLIDQIHRTGRAPNVLATMLHHPGLPGPFNMYGNVLLQQPRMVSTPVVFRYPE